MVKTSTSKQVVKYFQIAAETIEGTPNTSANFTTLGALPTEKISFKRMGNKEHEQQVGDEDVLAHVPGARKYQLNVDYFLDASAFTKRIVNAANPTTPAGTVSETLTGLYSILRDGSEVYRRFDGSRPASGSLKGEIGKALRGNMQLVCKDHPVPGAHGIGGSPTFVSTKPSNPIWHWRSGGATPITVEGSNVDAVSISVDFKRGSTEDHTFTSEKPHSSQPYDREVTYQLDVLWTSGTIEGYWDNNTDIDIVWTLKDAVSVLTLTDCSVDDYNTTDIVAGGKESVKESITGRVKSCVLT